MVTQVALRGWRSPPANLMSRADCKLGREGSACIDIEDGVEVPVHTQVGSLSNEETNSLTEYKYKAR